MAAAYKRNCVSQKRENGDAVKGGPTGRDSPSNRLQILTQISRSTKPRIPPDPFKQKYARLVLRLEALKHLGCLAFQFFLN